MRKKASVMAFAITLTAPPLLAMGPGGGTFDELHEALSGGTTNLDLRYRYEDIDSTHGSIPSLDQGNASTLRTVLSYKTATFRDVWAFLEFEDTATVLDTPFASAAIGGIPDPTGGSVNQFYLTYEGVDNLDIRVGRREIMLDNERFIGNYDWRQNHQALDGVSFQYTGVENLVATYVYVDSVSNWFAGDVRHDGTHLLNASYSIQDVGDVTGYYYRIDTDILPMMSTDTLGLRFDGNVKVADDTSVNYSAEWATQDDRGSNPRNVSETYVNLEAGATFSGINVGIQLERLGGSGNGGVGGSEGEFTTPLADFHEHNGLADVFTGSTLPGAGLEDLNLNASGEFEGIGWLVAFHMFDSNRTYRTALPANRDSYGEEVDIQVSYALNDNVDLGLLWANFNGFNIYPDVSKLVAWMSYRIL